MAIYSTSDIASSFSGDLCIADNGDIQVGDSLETYKSAANFLLRTDYGDYAPNGNVGSNLGNYIGEVNKTETYSSMERDARNSLIIDLFEKTDVSVDVVPFDINEALVVVSLAGYFMVDNELTYVQDERITFSFPYIDGNITPLVI